MTITCSYIESLFLSFVVPFPVSPLELGPVQSDPIVVRLSLTQEQHFGDLLIGLELSIPSGLSEQSAGVRPRPTAIE
ncbi:hypothetical protein EYF80_000555 [Liparis tanakae]|uniref:Uncharacterized protein n=1 Tax=Liparis tanakae TaxID=230148 RepID=A0A4Z2JH41_9TELE|nr:hypothetical protein EYF80_000555 [Liparis tanakae]